MSLDAIGVISRDTNKSIKFYSELGLEFTAFEGNEHFEATMASGLRLMIDSEELVKKLNPKWERPVGCGVVLCFLQETPVLVDAIYNELMESGAISVKSPWDAFWGQRYASVKDPDGNQVDIFADL